MGDVSDRIGRPTDNGQVCVYLIYWLYSDYKLHSCLNFPFSFKDKEVGLRHPFYFPFRVYADWHY